MMSRIHLGSRKKQLAIALGMAIVICAAAAMARPGSGQSYSGSSRSRGGSSGSGSGGGGGGDGGIIFELIFWLLIENPVIGVPIILVAIIFFIIKSRATAGMNEWSTTSAQVADARQSDAPTVVPRIELAQICATDPEFSLVLFEDFVYMLYAALQRGRATGMSSIAAYVAPDIAQSLQDPALSDVQGIIIGAMRYVSFSGVRDDSIELEVEIEANFVQVLRSGGERRFYVIDRIVLTRAASARSRPLTRSRTLDCPSCGAPLEAMRGTQCSYCKQDVSHGRFDWMIQRFTNVTGEPRGPLLTSDVDETGTDLPTIIDPGATTRLQTLEQRDATFTWSAVESRIAHIFGELQIAWTERDVKRIRPYISDNLFQSMVYWIDLYVRQHCRNVNENTRILGIELCNVLSDAHFDALTVRVFAEGLDYTRSDDGRVLSGSRSRPRQYSEYWTLIRAVNSKGAQAGENVCPNCSAPLNIGMAGNCEFCQAKVTSGEFDWVLSRIEQDEAYSG